MNGVAVRKVGDYMSKEPIVVHPGTDVHEAITLLARQNVCAIPVVDETNTLVGILSERDCLEAFLRAEYYESPNALVEELMCTEVVSVTAETDIFQAAELFAEKRFQVRLQLGALLAQLHQAMGFAKRSVVPTQEGFEALFHQLLGVKNHVSGEGWSGGALVLRGSQVQNGFAQPGSGFRHFGGIKRHRANVPLGGWCQEERPGGGCG